MEMRDFLPIFIIVIVGGLLWLRSAMVSLNNDVRVMLDRQAEIRARLDALEKAKG